MLSMAAVLRACAAWCVVVLVGGFFSESEKKNQNVATL